MERARRGGAPSPHTRHPPAHPHTHHPPRPPRARSVWTSSPSAQTTPLAAGSGCERGCGWCVGGVWVVGGGGCCCTRGRSQDVHGTGGGARSRDVLSNNVPRDRGGGKVQGRPGTPYRTMSPGTGGGQGPGTSYRAMSPGTGGGARSRDVLSNNVRGPPRDSLGTLFDRTSLDPPWHVPAGPWRPLSGSWPGSLGTLTLFQGTSCPQTSWVRACGSLPLTPASPPPAPSPPLPHAAGMTMTTSRRATSPLAPSRAGSTPSSSSE